MLKKLEVVFEGWGQDWVLGTLADDGRHLLFEYSPEAVKRGIEFSPRHLKLRHEAYGNFPDFLSRLPGIVSDALPDGWGLLLMDRLFRKAGRNPDQVSPLDRLAFIGRGAMGALTFRPSEELESQNADWSLLEIAQAARHVTMTGQRRSASTAATSRSSTPSRRSSTRSATAASRPAQNSAVVRPVTT